MGPEKVVRNLSGSLYFLPYRDSSQLFTNNELIRFRLKTNRDEIETGHFRVSIFNVFDNIEINDVIEHNIAK